MTDPLSDLARIEGVPSAIRAALDAADAVLRDRGRRPVPAETSARALLEGAKASASLDGDQWLPGAVRLSTELIDLAGAIRRTPAQVLARAHVLVARDVVAEHELGRVRPEADTSRLAALTELLTSPTKESALIVAALAHAEVAAISPFGGGDGVIARAVEHMVLIEAGIDPRAVLIPEAGHAASGAAYPRGLQRYASGSVAGVRDWIVQCASALTFGAESSPLGAAKRFRKDGRV